MPVPDVNPDVTAAGHTVVGSDPGGRETQHTLPRWDFLLYHYTGNSLSREAKR